MQRRHLVLAGVAALAGGCAPPEVYAPGSGSQGAGGAGGAGRGPVGPRFEFTVPPPAAGGAGGSGGPLAGEGSCGLERFSLERVPPALLLVLDRSGSMLESVGAGGSKWLQTTSALDQVIMRTQAGILWGLKAFPSDQNCGVAEGVNVAPAAENHAAMAAAIQTSHPIDEWPATPTRFAVQRATRFLAARTTVNPRYLLLATDGKPNCLDGKRSADDVAGALQAVADAAAQGIKTFVVGIATASSMAHETLNQMADRGQVPRRDPVRYYPVASRQEFVAVLEAIAGQVGSCTLQLGRAPPSPDDTAVDADGKRVPRDPRSQEGWSYGPDGKSVLLHGSWCDRLKAGAIKEVQIIFGCPGVVIP